MNSGVESAPYTLYRLDVSYFSGKLEAYLRYKQIPFRQIDVTNRIMRREILPNTGIAKVPVLATPDGLWLQDTTPIIEFLEDRFPEGSVIPADPVQAFFSRLLEDYADEWLWRPALHYRWSHALDAKLLGRRLADAILGDLPIPRSLAAHFIARRLFRTYVIGDGVNAETRRHVEATYTTALGRLEAILADRRFLLGDRPCIADFGFFASMFRHFSLDPTPAIIMRERAPLTFAWVARLWAAQRSKTGGAFETAGLLPDTWGPLLEDVASAYLPYLHANATAWRNGARSFDCEVEGVRYRDLPVVQYRVWCRERLQAHFDSLPAVNKRGVRDQLEAIGGWDPLWRDGRVASHLHDGTTPPICRPAARVIPRFAGVASWTGWNLPGSFDARQPTVPSLADADRDVAASKAR